MPLLAINDRVTAFGTFVNAFTSLYNDTNYCSFLIDEKTIEFQKLEVQNMLFGTRVTYVNPDNVHQEGIVVSRDKGNGYNIRLDTGLELTVLPATLSLSKSVDPVAPIVPKQVIESINSTIGDADTSCSEQPSNQLLENPQKELLRWHI